MGRRRAPPRGLTPEETKLWTQVTRDVTPIGPDLDNPRPVPPAPKPSPAASARPPRVDKPRSLAPAPVHRAPDPGWTGIDRGSRRRLKRGSYQVDGVLDLHGMTQTEAHGALTRFIQASVARGDVCLRIVTGKGLRGQLGAEPETRPFVMDERRPGVLRERVPQWLAEPPLRGLVRGIESAGPRQGGSGALYVLLKTRR